MGKNIDRKRYKYGIEQEINETIAFGMEEALGYGTPEQADLLKKLKVLMVKGNSTLLLDHYRLIIKRARYEGWLTKTEQAAKEYVDSLKEDNSWGDTFSDMEKQLKRYRSMLDGNMERAHKKTMEEYHK